MRLVTEDPINTLWETLSRFKSVSLAERHLKDRARKQGFELETEQLRQKAVALAYCIRNARENFRLPAASLTTSTTLNYYGCMWLASAVSVADPSSDAQLARLERHTKFGHGLKNISDDNGTFPDNQYICIAESGFFLQFLKWCKLLPTESSSVCLPGRLPANFDEIPNENRRFLVSLAELFARIPELRDDYEYVTGERAKNFPIFYDSSPNQEENTEDELARNTSQGIPPFTRAFTRRRDYTWIGIHGSLDYPAEYLVECGPPLTELTIRDVGIDKYWSGKLAHPPGANWFDHLAIYKLHVSSMSWIAPILGEIADPLAIHLMLLYKLSILARYRPAIWREIIEGELDPY
jgi:hypothetical protein